jgi:pimeloyl-ACP methyl ester carboxylesterase
VSGTTSPQIAAFRRRRIVWTIVAGAALLGLLAVLGYGSTPTPAEPGPLADVANDAGIHYSEGPDAVVMTPTSGADGFGLVFFPGAHIDAAAYSWKLSGLVDQGMTVVIARPILSYAILEFRPLTTFSGLAPGVSAWYVGGHSLGGVRACQYAKDDYTVTGLILFGSYCAADLSHSSLPVLSISGSRDGLSTPASIRNSAKLLPDTSTFYQIAGADHADFGDYGPQAGDRSSMASSASVRQQLTSEIFDFVSGED